MNAAIENILGALRAGRLNTAYEYRQYLNEIAVRLYQREELGADELEDLKGIITICNITYNDTDKELLPIEDGVYDLLLEKYKKYDPNFQVGAEVIRFKASQYRGPYVDKEMKEALIFNDPVNDKDVFFLNDIVVDPAAFIDGRDFTNVPEPVLSERITKRHHDTSHNHPELVGTLDKCKFVLDRDAIARGVYDDMNVKTVERDFFQDHLIRGIITPDMVFDMVLELKYDGVSVEADCTDEVVTARSRGDTGSDRASDFTPLLKGYKFPHRDKKAQLIGVKFEAIITQADLPLFNKAKGYEYKNGRSAIVGLMASGDAWKYRDFITLVPLAVEDSVFVNDCHSDRMEECKYLNDNFISKGCPLRYTMVRGNYIENLAWINLFTSNAEAMRYMVPFMYDGIVVSYRDPAIRKKLGRENFINKYSIAVKFNPMKKQTTFRGYTYTVGQDGSVTPMIHYDPVEFYGTIHDKSSGHSYARFAELKLHKGDIIDVEYVNDVMPYVSKGINEWNLDNEKVTPAEVFPNRCPICGSMIEISESGRSAKCLNPDCGGRQLSRMVNMFTKLGLEGFGESTITQLGKYHLKDLMELVTQDNWDEELRIRGFGPIERANIHGQLMNLLKEPLVETKLLGAIGFTNISRKTWELIIPHVDYHKLREMFNLIDPSRVYYKRMIDYLTTIKGVGPMKADTIAREFRYFQDDIDWMVKHGNVINYVETSKREIRFSGFRDKALSRELESLGFDANMSSDVTRKTYLLLVPNLNYMSSKVAQARSYGIMIVPVKEFKENIQRYL